MIIRRNISFIINSIGFILSHHVFTTTTAASASFFLSTSYYRYPKSKVIILNQMKRPILDQVASSLLKLENDRVEQSSILDEKGRIGEPMEWSEGNSMANQLSKVMASGPGYMFKQFVADAVAGEYDEQETGQYIDGFISAAIQDRQVAMLSFSTCPFCRRAKDYLDENNIVYTVIELDDLDGNRGNEIRASLGKKVKRTSVPAIWIGEEFVGGCNDGPGLLTLANQGQLKDMLDAASITYN